MPPPTKLNQLKIKSILPNPFNPLLTCHTFPQTETCTISQRQLQSTPQHHRNYPIKTSKISNNHKTKSHQSSLKLNKSIPSIKWLMHQTSRHIWIATRKHPTQTIPNQYKQITFPQRKESMIPLNLYVFRHNSPTRPKRHDTPPKANLDKSHNDIGLTYLHIYIFQIIR